MVEESCHPIFTQNPTQWMQYIYKKVRVVTGPNQDIMGRVYTVDPVTSSLVLVHFPFEDALDSTTATTTTASAANVDEAFDRSAITSNTTSDTISEAKTSTTTSTTATTTTTTTNTPECSVEVSVIPGHAVVEVIVLPEDNDSSDYETIKERLDALFLNSKHGYGDISGINNISHLSEESLSERRDKLKSWFLKNRLPVQEQKGKLGGGNKDKGQYLNVAGAVTIVPPYGPSNCCSTNEIILSRIQTLIRNMPPTV